MKECTNGEVDLVAEQCYSSRQSTSVHLCCEILDPRLWAQSPQMYTTRKHCSEFKANMRRSCKSKNSSTIPFISSREQTIGRSYSHLLPFGIRGWISHIHCTPAILHSDVHAIDHCSMVRTSPALCHSVTQGSTQLNHIPIGATKLNKSSTSTLPTADDQLTGCDSHLSIDMLSIEGSNA